MRESLVVGELSKDVTCNSFESELRFIDSQGVPLRISDVRSIKNPTDAGSILQEFLEQLEEQAILTEDDTGALIAHATLPRLQDFEADFIELLVPWSPHTLTLKESGTIGYSDFKFVCEFKLGRRTVALRRIGAFVTNGHNTYRLPESTYQIVTSAHKFNQLPEREKTKEAALRVLHSIQVLSGAAGADLSQYLEGEQVVAPDKILIGAEEDNSQRLSLYPVLRGVSEHNLRDEFMRYGTVQDIYDLPAPNGKRVRVLLDDELKAIFRDLIRVRRIGGTEKALVLEDPSCILSDGTNKDRVVCEGLSARVRGFGEVTKRSKIWIKGKERNWFSSEIGNDSEPDSLSPPSTSGPSESNEGAAQVAEIGTENATGSWDGTTISEVPSEPYSGENSSPSSPSTGTFRKGSHGSILIYTNEEALEYSEGHVQDLNASYGKEFILPKSLLSSISNGSETFDLQVKPHQLEGIKWLSLLHSHRQGRRGCMLADDMGLGKTLQISIFLAKAIEEKEIEIESQNFGLYNPILIVCPKILLDNWQDEIDKYFQPGTFDPILKLHGSELRRACEFKESEDVTGAAAIRDEVLRRNKLIITTYDTVKNYIRSFARVNRSVACASLAGFHQRL